MNTGAAIGREHDQEERAIGSLCDRTGASRADVRALFAHEFARLAVRATVPSYLRLLTAANVYAMLRHRPAAAQLPTLRGGVSQPRQAIQAVGAGPHEQDVEAPIFLPPREQR